MIVGDNTAGIIGLNLPGNITNGFSSPGPINTNGEVLPPADAPGMVIYLQDDAWQGVSQDHIKLWNIVPDFDNPENSTISQPQEIITAPFDSFFNAFGVGDIEQPNTSQRIDAIGGAIMFQVQYRPFENHNSIVFNHSVDTDGALKSGVRWNEFRQPDINTDWSIHQQGTYAPDTESRFMGSIHIDRAGTIGLAYAVSGPNTFASLRYTGRFINDPLGEMSVEEQTIRDGTSNQATFNRFGDYSQLSIDPEDDLTFWYTGEYFGAGLWRTQIASFKLSAEFEADLGVSLLQSPEDGALSDEEEITVTVRNYGSETQSNFPVSYQVDGGAVITETFTGSLESLVDATFTFAQTTDLSIEGQTYTIATFTELDNDAEPINDDIEIEVRHLFTNDVGVVGITSPLNSDELGVENIEVILRNFGSTSQTAIPVTYSVDGGATISEVFTGTINEGETASFTFTTPVDFTDMGVYNVVTQTNLATDQDIENDSFSRQIVHLDCIPTSTGTNATNGCTSDGIKNFELGVIENISGCGTDGDGVGYSDFTELSTDLDRSVQEFDVVLRSSFAPEAVSIWIDFDDSGSWEPSEQVLSDAEITVADQDQTFTITIPANAAIGSHILRAKAIDADGTGSGIDDPCGDVQWGETEDYTVNIVDSTLGLGDLTITNDQFRVIPLGNQSYEVVLDLAFELNEELMLDIHNITGQRIASQKIEYENGAYNTQLNLNTATGIYLATVSNTQISTSKKFVVK